MMRLLREARRRRVFRGAALYIVGAWVLLQVADVLFPAFGIDPSRISVLVYAALLGFPVALVFGWMFDVTKDGIRRTAAAATGEEPPSLALRRSDYAILACLTIVVALILYGLFTEIPPPATEKQDKLENSIAVLAFANIGEAPESETISYGMSEEIRQRLGHFGELNIIGRTSVEAVKDEPISTIAEFLGTQYLLQGSVRRAGDQLRISAVLLDDRGVQLWAESYDRRLENVFEIQTEIADAVAKTIVPQIVSTSRPAVVPDLDAYEHYVKGRELLHARRRFAAREELRKAIEIDPEFADPHAELAIALTIGHPPDEELEEARQLIATALALRPGMPRALAARGLLLMQQREPNHAAAEAVLRQVVQEDPNMSDGLLWLSNALDALDKHDEAIAILERAIRLDPLHMAIIQNLSTHLIRSGEHERGERVLLRLEAAPPGKQLRLEPLYTLYERRGQLHEAIQLAKREVMNGGATSYLRIARLYAEIGDFESSDYWLQRSKVDLPKHPLTPFFDAMLASWQGRYAEAADLWRLALDANGRTVDDLSVVPRRWLGWIQAPSDRHESTIDVLEPVVSPDKLDAWSVSAGQALAWAYAETGRDEKAATILATLNDYFAELDENDLLFHESLPPLNDGYYRYALNTQLMGDFDLALDRLEEAVERGWRGYYLNHHDSRWDVLRDNPRFQELMAFVKADVDRQRAEQRRVDAEDNFIARLDAKMAAGAEDGY